MPTAKQAKEYIADVEKQIDINVGHPLREAERKAKESKRRAAKILSGDETEWRIEIFPHVESNEVLIEFFTASEGAARHALRALLESSYGFAKYAFLRAFPDATVKVEDRNGDTITIKLAALMTLAMNREREARGLPPKEGESKQRAAAKLIPKEGESK